MIWLSALFVFGTFALALVGMDAQDNELPLGYEQLIHARTPWLLLGLLWTGLALGIASVVHKRAALRISVLCLELPLVGFASWYFLSGSILPAHPLAVTAGDAFPAYALVDQDGRLHRSEVGAAREPALYIFYRGDW